MNEKHLTPRATLLVALLAVMLSFISNNYAYGKSDMAHYLTFLNHLENPALYPGDLLLSSFAAHHTYFWHIVALLSSESSRPGVLLAMNLAVAFFMALLYIAYGKRMSRDYAVVIIVLLLFIKQWHCPVETELEISYSEMTQTEFAMPFLLLSFLLFIHGRFVPAVFLASLMLHIQGQYAVYFLFSYALALLPELRQLGLRQAVLIALAVLAAASPLFFQLGEVVGGDLTPEQFQLYNEILHARKADSLAVLQWPFARWQGLVFLIVLGAAGWWLKEEHTAQDRRLLRLLPGPALLMLAGLVFVEFYPVHPIFFKLVLFKSVSIALLVLFMYSALFIHYLLRQRELFPRFVGLAWLLIFVFNPRINLEFAGPLMLCTLLAYRYRRLFHVHPDPRPFFQALFVSIAMIITVTRGALPLARGEFSNPLHFEAPEDWQEVQRWARDNTQVDALFITPFYQKGFRILSQRSTIAEYKDGSPLMFTPRAEIEWWKRMAEFGMMLKAKKQDLKRLYESMSQQDVERLSGKYRASYLVATNAMNMDLPLLYANESYRVYQIRSEQRKD